MKATFCSFVIVALLLLGGCRRTTTQRKELTEPLTFEKWKKLPKQVKYTGDTLEHLRKTLKHEDEKMWRQYLAKNVTPYQKKDFPNSEPPR